MPNNTLNTIQNVAKSINMAFLAGEDLVNAGEAAKLQLYSDFVFNHGPQLLLLLTLFCFIIQARLTLTLEY